MFSHFGFRRQCGTLKKGEGEYFTSLRKCLFCFFFKLLYTFKEIYTFLEMYLFKKQ